MATGLPGAAEYLPLLPGPGPVELRSPHGIISSSCYELADSDCRALCRHLLGATLRLAHMDSFLCSASGAVFHGLHMRHLRGSRCFE